MHVSHVIEPVDGAGHAPPSPASALASEPPSSPDDEPLLLPEELPEELPDDEPLLLPDVLPEELPDELPLDELVPPSPVLDDDVHAGCTETMANPPTTAMTADQANLFMCFSRSPEEAALPAAQFKAR
jgi:hypothetical protein